LRNLSKDSKEDLKKALEEMEGYANLLVQFEEKIRQAEEAKIRAIEEKEKAEEEIKTIRQRYINILGVRDL
jgi:allophanate hydrolase subunit 1